MKNLIALFSLALIAANPVQIIAQEAEPIPQVDLDSIPLKNRLTVTSLDASGKTTVAGVKGYLLEPALVETEHRQAIYELGIDKRIELTIEHGQTFTTGADGTWTGVKPSRSDFVWIYLEKDGFSGFDSYHPNNSSPCDIHLYPITSIEVLTVDETGVALPNTRFRILDRSRERFTNYAIRSKTDEHGKRELRHLGQFLHKLDQGDGLSIVPMIAMSEEVMYETNWPKLTHEAIQSGQIQLRLPPMCSITFRAVDSNGEPIQENGYINLGPIQEKDYGWRWFPHDQAKVIDGMATFERVGTEALLEASLNLNNERARKKIPVHSPGNAGEQREIDLEFFPNSMILAQLLKPDGSPAANANVQVSYGDEANTNYTTKGKTDGKGLLKIKQRAFTEYEHTFLKRLVVEIRTAKPAVYRQSMPLNPGFHEATLDLGEVELEAVPILLSGRITDQLGNGIDGAWVHVDPVIDPRKGFSGRPHSYWAISESDGRYLIEGKVDPESEYDISVRKNHYDTLETKFKLDGNRRNFQLTPAGRITGTVLLDEGINIDDLSFELNGQPLKWNQGLRPGNSSQEIRLDLPSPLTEDHEFVVMTKLRETVAQVSGLSLKSSQSESLAALQPLDLRGKLKRIEFLIKDKDGVAEDAQVSALGNKVRVFVRLENGSRSCVALGPIEKVWVRTTGFNEVILNDVWEDQEVQLQASFEVKVKIPKKLMNIPHITPSLTTNTMFNQPMATFGPFNSEGEAVFYIAEPGDYRIGLRLTHSREGGGTSSSGHQGQYYRNLKHGSVVELKLDNKWVNDFVKRHKED